MQIKVGVIGHTGFVGQNIATRLLAMGRSFVGGSRHNGVDARDINSVISWISTNDITHIINLAAECGGIGLNQRSPATLWAATTQISVSVLEAARVCNVKKLIMVGTVCSYAKHCPVPFKESDILHYGDPEETNQAYGLAKLNSLYGSKAYHKQHGLNVANLVPVNMYGPHDHFDLDNSHVIPALIRKMSDAKLSGSTVTLWGDGSATREFLYVGDFVDALLLVLDNDSGPEFINIGSGEEISIKDLAIKIAGKLNFRHEIKWDATKPNGQPRRCLDTTKAFERFGFKASTSLDDGLQKTVEWYLSHGR